MIWVCMMEIHHGHENWVWCNSPVIVLGLQVLRIFYTLVAQTQKKPQQVQVVELHKMRVDRYPTCEGSIAGCWSLIISTMESWKSSLHSPDPVVVAPISTCGLNNSTSRSLWRWIHWDPWLVSDYLWNMTNCQESSWSFLDIVTAWTNSYGLIYI